jgi:hypothetical protein
MKKMTTLYKKDPNDLGRVINEINTENRWVFESVVLATIKRDGTACAIIKGELYKRYDAKINRKTGEWKKAPKGAIPCQDPDETTGHHPHWVRCCRENPQDKYHYEAFDKMSIKKDGTYELCGEKIGKNPEQIKGNVLIKHGEIIKDKIELSFNGIKNWLKTQDIEGVVFYEVGGEKRMCKIRKKDFGLKREDK